MYRQRKVKKSVIFFFFSQRVPVHEVIKSSAEIVWKKAAKSNDNKNKMK